MYSFIINLKILTAIQMDYNMLFQTLPKSYIKWSVADMEKFLNFIGLPGLFSKFSKPYLILRIIVNRW